jgi:signal transduction histidine kinase
MKTTSAKSATNPLTKELKHALSPIQETPNLASQNFNEKHLSTIEDESMPDQRTIAPWRERAKRGDAEAQNNLGVTYLDGKGTPQNYEAAIKWFNEAATQGSAIAKFNLANAYRKGTEVPQNDKLALELLEEILTSKSSIEETNLFSTPFNPDASLVWMTREAIQAIKLKAANRVLENILSMVAHEFGGPLDSLEYNLTSQNDLQRALRFIKMMHGLRKTFGVISMDAAELRRQMQQDKHGEGTLLTLLEQSLEFSLSSLLTPQSFGRISQHYFAYAKKHHLFTLERRDWEKNHLDGQLLDLKERLQNEWQKSFHAIAAQGKIDHLLKWIEEHFFHLDLQGFQNEQIRFRKYGITESVLTIIFTEILSNAIKYYNISCPQPVLLHWQCDQAGGRLTCQNPASRLECYDKGSKKGHDFLKLIATNMNGQFTTTLSQEQYITTFIIPTELLMEETL